LTTTDHLRPGDDNDGKKNDGRPETRKLSIQNLHVFTSVRPSIPYTMDGDLYDEFGNYIGSDSGSEEDAVGGVRSEIGHAANVAGAIGADADDGPLDQGVRCALSSSVQEEEDEDRRSLFVDRSNITRGRSTRTTHLRSYTPAGTTTAAGSCRQGYCLA